MFLRQLISSVDRTVFKNYSKIHLESTKFENQCIQFLKIQSCEKSVKDINSGE